MSIQIIKTTMKMCIVFLGIFFIAGCQLAFLNGPVIEATVKIFEHGSDENLISDTLKTSTISELGKDANYDGGDLLITDSSIGTVALNSVLEDHAGDLGVIELPSAVILDKTKFYRIEVSGGWDIDHNTSGTIDTAAYNSSATLRALVPGVILHADWRNLNMDWGNVTPLTTMAHALAPTGELSTITLSAALHEISLTLLKGDRISYFDVLAWQPSSADQLRHPEDIEAVVAALKAGDDITSLLHKAPYDNDGDTVFNTSDNCPEHSNSHQTDTDGDGEGNACDADADNDGISNAADSCPYDANDTCPVNDSDDDGIAETQDNCPNNPNSTQEDGDDDGTGDACDTEDNGDDDSDGIENHDDNCPKAANFDQTDTDGDQSGDACDSRDNRDLDGDGYQEWEDNCPGEGAGAYNPIQSDVDDDNLGDACDNEDNKDDDGDGIENYVDNCPITPNPDQSDIDADNAGDECDSDIDGDAALNVDDACPNDADNKCDAGIMPTPTPTFTPAVAPPTPTPTPIARELSLKLADAEVINREEFLPVWGYIESGSLRVRSYHFVSEKAVLRSSVTRSTALHQLMIFSINDSQDAISKWIDSQGTDYIYLDGAVPTRKIDITPYSQKLSETFLNHETGACGDEWDVYQIEFSIADIIEPGDYTLFGFSDSILAHESTNQASLNNNEFYDCWSIR